MMKTFICFAVALGMCFLTGCKSTPKKKRDSVQKSIVESDNCSDSEAAVQFKIPSDARESLLKALSTSDYKRLKDSAVCHFFIGLPQSDSAAWGNPRKIMKTLVASLRNVAWAEEDKKFQNQLNITGNQGDYYFELVLKKSGNGKWTWVGFNTNDEALLRELSQLGEFASP